MHSQLAAAASTAPGNHALPVSVQVDATTGRCSVEPAASKTFSAHEPHLELAWARAADFLHAAEPQQRRAASGHVQSASLRSLKSLSLVLRENGALEVGLSMRCVCVFSTDRATERTRQLGERLA